MFVGEGLLDLMSSEDQLAFILGHELDTFDHYHCAERVQVEARLRNLKLGIMGALIQIPLEVWEAGYSKDEEREADREGLRLSVLSGYSPYGTAQSPYSRSSTNYAPSTRFTQRARRRSCLKLPFRVWRDIFAHIRSLPNA